MFQLTEVRCVVRKKDLNYDVCGIVHDRFSSCVTITLRKKHQQTDVFLRITFPQKEEFTTFKSFYTFAQFRNAKLSCEKLRDHQHAQIKLTFTLTPRDRTFRECLSVMEQTLHSIEQALSIIN